MKLNLPKLMSMLIFTAAVLLNFSCAKDSDLLVDYVVDDNNTAIEEDKEEEPQEVVIDLENAAITTKEDKPVTFNILNNTTSKGGGRRTYKSSRNPKYGELTIQKDSIALYSPLNDFNGTDDLELTLEVTNEDETTSEVVVTVDITIDAVTDVIQDTIVTTTDDPIVIEPLKNDTFNKESTVSITEISEPANGTAVLNNNNTITYTPKANTSGEDTFTYTTSITNVDETVNTEKGTIIVSKEAVTEVPPASGDMDYGPLKAFPTAFGGGANVTGGRGGRVIHVTNLNASGSGSLREAVEASGKRTIVFDVSGNINLGGAELRGNSDLTIAGQTAPKGGITFTNGTIKFSGKRNIIIRYMRGRPAEATSGEVKHGDAFIFSGCDDVILDHVSVSFGGDQATTLAAESSTHSSRRHTVQRSIFSDSYTGVLLGDSNAPFESTDDVSFIYNVVVDMPHRTPNVGGTGSFEVINNVIYNWRNRATNINQSAPHLNHIANYYKRGRSTEQNSVAANANKVQTSASALIYTRKNYYSGNVLKGLESENNEVIWSTFSGSNPVPSRYFVDTQFPLIGVPVPIMNATEAYSNVLADVGANKYIDDNGTVQLYLDEYDTIKIFNIKNDISTKVYRDYSSWRIPSLPTNKRANNYDTDGDGMADAWELANGLDPNNPDDAAADRNNDGYTNLEDFLNQVDFL
ncbi:Ig-like domain-containing protein [Arenibacter nanhaiticus]|nr:Ig-like domain-containing protein [Arenibacter nanhaiticus]